MLLWFTLATATPLVHDTSPDEARARADAVGLDGTLEPVSLAELREAPAVLRAGGEVLGPCTPGLPDTDRVRGHLLYGELDPAAEALAEERLRCGGRARRAELERSAGVLAMFQGDEQAAAAAFAVAKGFDPELSWDPGFPADHQAVFDAATPATTELTVVPAELARIDGEPLGASVARGVHGVTFAADGVAVRLEVADDELVVPSAFPAQLPALADEAARREVSSLLAAALGEGRRAVVVGPDEVWSGTTGRVDWDRLEPLAASRPSPAPWVLAAGGGLVAGVGAVLAGTGLTAAADHADAMGRATVRADYDAARSDYDAAAGRAVVGYGATGVGLGIVAIGIGWGVLR